jgi:hypothetical protein
VNAKDSLGRRGERAAVEYLERAGLRPELCVTAHHLSSTASSSENSPGDLSFPGVARWLDVVFSVTFE